MTPADRLKNQSKYSQPQMDGKGRVFVVRWHQTVSAVFDFRFVCLSYFVLVFFLFCFVLLSMNRVCSDFYE